LHPPDEGAAVEYLEWDFLRHLQSIGSDIRGILSANAVFRALGIGKTGASAAGALTVTLLQELVGNGAVLGLSYSSSATMSSECKYYRLVAEVAFTAARLLEMFAGGFGPFWAAIALVLAKAAELMSRAFGQSSTQVMNTHLAHQNVAQFCVKLEAQRSLRRTLVTIASILFVPWLALASDTLIWVLFAALTVLHFMGNLFLVRAVRLGDLNANRMDAGLSSVLRCSARSIRGAAQDHGIILRPNW